MINKDTITSLWDTISFSGEGEFEYQLLSKDVIPQLNIGLNRDHQRCLILELPLGFKKEFRQFDGENLSLKYFLNESCICIILNDGYFFDLFDDLIFSIYDKISQTNKPEEYSNDFVSYFYKWNSFFVKPKDLKLSKEEVQGLFGELHYLTAQIIDFTQNTTSILNSWKGPYDSGHDFEFEFINYEIKTIESNVNSVKISSEFQLEPEAGKDLELKVIIVIQDTENGLSIMDLALHIKELIYQSSGDLVPFISALSQKSLTFKNIGEYNHYRFIALKEITYRCNESGFPKIISSDLPKEITKVSYRIRLSLIADYIKNEIEY
jgi:hypothetical protein